MWEFESIYGSYAFGMANAELFTSARESALQIVHKLKDIPPFSYLEEKRITAHIQKVFSNEYLENAMAYAQSLASGNLMNALDPQYQKALTLLRVVPVLAHLGYSLEQFRILCSSLRSRSIPQNRNGRPADMLLPLGTFLQ